MLGNENKSMYLYNGTDLIENILLLLLFCLNMLEYVGYQIKVTFKIDTLITIIVVSWRIMIIVA